MWSDIQNENQDVYMIWRIVLNCSLIVWYWPQKSELDLERDLLVHTCGHGELPAPSPELPLRARTHWSALVVPGSRVGPCDLHMGARNWISCFFNCGSWTVRRLGTQLDRWWKAYKKSAWLTCFNGSIAEPISIRSIHWGFGALHFDDHLDAHVQFRSGEVCRHVRHACMHADLASAYAHMLQLHLHLWVSAYQTTLFLCKYILLVMCKWLISRFHVWHALLPSFWLSSPGVQLSGVLRRSGKPQSMLQGQRFACGILRHTLWC